MPKGRPSRTLNPEYRARLEKFRRLSHEGARSGYSLAQLRSAMAAPFGWQTLKKALAGQPVWELSHAYIMEWIDRYLPAAPVIHSGKDAAAGDGPEEENGEESEATRTVRGSR